MSECEVTGLTGVETAAMAMALFRLQEGEEGIEKENNEED